MTTIYITISILVIANIWLFIALYKKNKEWAKWEKILEPFKKNEDDDINFA